MGRLPLVACSSLAAGALAAGALAGCAQIFGLDPTSAPVDASSSEGSASVSIVRRSIGATVIDGLEAATSVTWMVTGSDGTIVPTAGVQDASGVYRVTLPAGSGIVPVEIVLGSDSEYPTVPRILLDLPAPDLQFLDADYEPATPVVAPTTPLSLAAQVAITTPYAAGDIYYLEVVGGWGYHHFSDAELLSIEGDPTTMTPPTTSFAATEVWDTGTDDTFTPWTASPLYAIGSDDVLVCTHYTGNSLVEAGTFSPQFDQSTPPAAITTTLTPVVTQPLDVTVYPAAAAALLAEPRPAGGAGAMSWAVTASPGYATAMTLGPQLTSGSVAAAGPDPVAISAPFGDPFTWPATFESHISSTRAVTLGSAAAFGATSGQFDDYAPAGSGSAALDLATRPPLPIEITVDSTILATDGMTVPLDLTQPIQIAAQTDPETGAATLYTYSVVQLTLDPTTLAYSRDLTYMAIAETPSIALPGSIFMDGGTYLVRVETFDSGVPNAASGDLATRTLPLSDALSESAVFTVMAQ